MKAVERSEIVDWQTYEENRESFQREVFAAKAHRRISVGDCFTFLFENALTVRYQIQEMMRVEKIVKESEIRHEIKTYNDLLGASGELGCTLLIEIDDPGQRAVLLRQWLQLPEHVYARLEDGRKIRPSFDPAQRGNDRISSVQYLKFPLNGRLPVAIGIDLPGIESETVLMSDQRTALAEDLAS